MCRFREKSTASCDLPTVQLESLHCETGFMSGWKIPSNMEKRGLTEGLFNIEVLC